MRTNTARYVTNRVGRMIRLHRGDNAKLRKTQYVIRVRELDVFDAVRVRHRVVFGRFEGIQ